MSIISSPFADIRKHLVVSAYRSLCLCNQRFRVAEIFFLLVLIPILFPFRYDARLHLHDLDLHDASRVGRSDDREEGNRNPGDADESELEFERYRDLMAADDHGMVFNFCQNVNGSGF